MGHYRIKNSYYKNGGMKMNIDKMIEELIKAKETMTVSGDSEVVIESSDGIQVSTIGKVVVYNGRVFIVERN